MDHSCINSRCNRKIHFIRIQNSIQYFTAGANLSTDMIHICKSRIAHMMIDAYCFLCMLKQIVSKRQTAGTGDRQANRFVAASEVHKLLVDVDQQAGHGGTHVGVVASVIGEEGVSQGIGLIKHHGLDGGGTDVQSHTQGLRV